MRTSVRYIESHPVYFKGNHYIGIASLMWRVDQDDLFTNIFTEFDGYRPNEMTAIPTHILYYTVEKKILVPNIQNLRQTTGGQFSAVPNAPKYITRLYSVNDRAFIASPGAAYSFDPDLGSAVLLDFWCNKTTECTSPSDFVHDGKNFYYRGPGGVWQTDAKTETGTTLWCGNTVCANATTLVNLGPQLFIFSQMGNILVISKVSTQNQNSTEELIQLPGYSLETSSRFNYVSSDRFYFFLYNSTKPHCVELWATTGTKVTTFKTTDACIDNSIFKVINVQEPADMGFIYFQGIITNLGTMGKEVQLWEFNKKTATMKTVTKICSTASVNSTCDATKEYFQTITSNCVAHWGEDGFYIRSADDLPSSPASSLTIPMALLFILIAILSFLY